MLVNVDELLYRVELWDEEGISLEETISANRYARDARAAFESAIEAMPNQYITLRQRTRVLEKHVPNR